MKIYFSAAIVFKDKRGEIYDQIVKVLKQLGHKVFSYEINNTDIPEILSLSNKVRAAHYRNVLKWISSSELMVVEASFPSTIHIGHEITLALEKGKPVIALYEKGFEPFFLSSLDSEKLFLVEYTHSDLDQKVKDALSSVGDSVDTRFNFFISPEIGRFLDWTSQTKKVPRAVFLRNLLERAMKSDKDFTG